jgi:hypothetical protein
MPNQFYVHPGMDIGPGLAGLAGQLSQASTRVEQREEKERIAGLREEAATILQSGDPAAIAEFSMRNPEVAKELSAAAKFRSEQTKENYVQSIFEALQNPDKVEDIVSKRQRYLKAQGLGADETQETDVFLDKYRDDPEKTLKSLEQELAWMAPDRYKQYAEATGKSTKPTPRQKTGAFLVRDPETKETKIATGVFDPLTGKLTTETATLGAADLISKVGETAKETTERKILEKRGEERAKGEEKRAADLIDRGVLAAESTAILRRGIELMDLVKTGGMAGAAIAVKNFFGVEGADEGELSANLGKAVLSQLRETFGAQFTEAEGARLMRIEAGIRKSPETNIRLLKQALRIAERTAKRARKKALDQGDQATVDDIDDLLEFSLSLKVPTEGPPEETTGDIGGMSDEELKNLAFGGQ